MIVHETTDLEKFLSEILKRTVSLDYPAFEQQLPTGDFSAMVYRLGEQEFIPTVFDHNRDTFSVAFEKPSKTLEDALDDADLLKSRLCEIRHENDESYNRGLEEDLDDADHD